MTPVLRISNPEVVAETANLMMAPTTTSTKPNAMSPMPELVFMASIVGRRAPGSRRPNGSSASISTGPSLSPGPGQASVMTGRRAPDPRAFPASTWPFAVDGTGSSGATGPSLLPGPGQGDVNRFETCIDLPFLP